MNDWFEWKGQRCTSFGIHVSEQPPITMPKERVTYTSIPGKSGSLATLEGQDVYDDITLTVNCWIEDVSQLPSVMAWLQGGSTVTFANRPNGHYEARVANQIAFNKILAGYPHRKFAINFRCKPYFILDDAPTITVTESMTFVTNPESIHSEPVITVYGEGNITLMVNMTIVELFGIEGSIILDSQTQEAYTMTDGFPVSMNHKMAGDFPVLASGANAISWEGNVDRVEIVPRFRRL